jgi:hypothetical protein
MYQCRKCSTCSQQLVSSLNIHGNVVSVDVGCLVAPLSAACILKGQMQRSSRRSARRPWPILNSYLFRSDRSSTYDINRGSHLVARICCLRSTSSRSLVSMYELGVVRPQMPYLFFVSIRALSRAEASKLVCIVCIVIDESTRVAR